MSLRLTTPLNQQRQTNIAVVRMNVKGKKFEVAAYKNKVVSWRNGFEKDVDEVLQTPRVYFNVSKGELPSKEELMKNFGTDDELKVCITILNKGELQISSKEREVMFESMYRDIVTIVCNMCINPDTQRPYPPGVIDRALKELHFAVKPGKSAKKQALEVIRKLKKTIKIERAQMRLQIHCTEAALSRKVKSLFKSGEGTIEKDFFNPDDKSVTLTVLIDPGLFRTVDEFANEHSDSCTVSVVDTTVQQEGEEKIDDIVSDDEETIAHEEEEIHVTESKSSGKKKKKRGKKAATDEDDEEDEGKRGKKKAGKKKAAASESDEEELDDIAPKKSKKKKNNKKAIQQEETSTSKSGRKKNHSDDEDDPSESSSFVTGKAKASKKKKNNKKGKSQNEEDDDE